ncbi:DNA translocase FtsK 4TM domain-containing protein [candidate division WOR-3 bacterium]|nr:DNA translocase FtsK 4TM domain-containing protein [candidate division WOR-3 bacterium]
MNTLFSILKSAGKILLFSALGLVCFYFLFVIFKFFFSRAVTLPKKKWKDLSAIIFLAFSLYMLTAFCSYSFFPQKHLAGYLGHWTSSWLFYLFGWQTWLLLAELFLVSWKLAFNAWSENKDNGKNQISGLLSLLMVIALSSMSILGMYTIPGKKPVGNFTEYLASGQVGRVIAEYGSAFLGRAGFFLAVLIFLFTTSVLAVGLDALKIFGGLKKIFFSMSKIKVQRTKKKKNDAPKKERKIPVKSLQIEEINKDEDLIIQTQSPEYENFIDTKSQETILSLLEENDTSEAVPPAPENKLAAVLEKKLSDFNIKGKVTDIETGPVITTIEFFPEPGIKLSKISSLSDDMAMAMHAEKVRIVAPIPGKSVVGFEIPNKTKSTVYLKSILTDQSFRSSDQPLTIALGVTTSNQPQIADLSLMPHLLVAGTTGSGKSVCINSIICSLISRISPKNLRFIMIDPKRIELSIYNGIPHLVRPVIVEPKHAPQILNSLISWMDLRYKDFGKLGVRNISSYNKKVPPELSKPYIVAVIDELADLMMTTGKIVEDSLIRLAQMSRAVGIHLILATQRPSVNVITGLIKANFPARIAFKTSSQIDSRTILDGPGAEKLLGKGDMLFSSPGMGEAIRLHGAYISTEEARRIVKFWAQNHLEKLLKGKFAQNSKIPEMVANEDQVLDAITDPESTPGAEEILERFFNNAFAETGTDKEVLSRHLSSLTYYPPIKEQEEVPLPDFSPEENWGDNVDGLDPLYEEAKEFVLRTRVASVSAIQRHFKVGYARAGRIIDQLENNKIIGPHQGSKSRDVYGEKEIK